MYASKNNPDEEKLIKLSERLIQFKKLISTQNDFTQNILEKIKDNKINYSKVKETINCAEKSILESVTKGYKKLVLTKETVDDIDCYKYSINNHKKSFDVILPARFVEQKNFGTVMSSLQTAVKTNDDKILYEMIAGQLSETEKKSTELIKAIKSMAKDLVELHKKNWDGIWVRIATNFMLIARLQEFDLIVGNPPWVKWEHLPQQYSKKIKELCNIRHIFSTRGRFGGTQLNICALISNVAATNWLKDSGVLAFLMPDSIMSQNSYEEFRYFYLDYENDERLFLQKIDKMDARQIIAIAIFIIFTAVTIKKYNRDREKDIVGLIITMILRKREWISSLFRTISPARKKASCADFISR